MRSLNSYLSVNTFFSSLFLLLNILNYSMLFGYQLDEIWNEGARIANTDRMETSMHSDTDKKIHKYVLDNGLTVLVRSTHAVPKVSTQLWYNVGSKDEKNGQKGIAHLIEHMIFKGTHRLSESDINMITHKLSGYCNAFTSFDYTGYLFDFPSHNWRECISIMADCMRNCTFKQELLNSEMKAVIQELKMYRDNYVSSLIEAMISKIFTDHPYHYPIIGYKRDLWNLKSQTLHDFYKKHYVPNNATLVVVGDVDPAEVFHLAQQHFGSIDADPTYVKEQFYHTSDILSTGVTLYRDIKQPSVLLAYAVPGSKEKIGYLFDVLSWILGEGKGSRLYKKLVDDLQLVTEVEAFTYDLFDLGLFFIYLQPKKIEDINLIIKLIGEELESLATKGADDNELQRAIKQTRSEYFSLLENNQKQAYGIGQSYLATNDENFLFNYFNITQEELKKKIPALLSYYFKPTLMHTGLLLPLAEGDREYWLALQHESDQEDKRILSGIERTTPVEPGVVVETIKVNEPTKFNFPKPRRFTLSNGLKVLYYHNPNVPKIEAVLELKAKHYYDPDNLQGLYSFMCAMMYEGTKHYTGHQLTEAIESLGMSLNITPGYVALSMLSDDLPKGLELLEEILSRPTFEEPAIEKVREQLIADLKNYWDEPGQFVSQLARSEVYKNHPYSKELVGDFTSIEKITSKDLRDFYAKYVTPQEATLAVVGDLEKYSLQEILERTLSAWQGPIVPSLDFPALKPVVAHKVNRHMNRDQVVVAFAGLSLARKDPDFDKILLFDQIFTGGVLGSMSSRLFDLREATGLFYTIGGSLLSRADEQPGMVYIKTKVSLDRLHEAEKAIEETINTAVESLSDQELIEAKHALINSLVENFQSNRHIASTFLFAERFGLSDTYFDTRAQTLLAVPKDDVINAVKKILSTKHMLLIQIGRV